MIKKILVCDDDQDILDLVALILEGEFEVQCEIDSTKLVARAKALQPDVILLDMWMPNISGDQLAGALKQQPNLEQTPVIIFSASKDGRAKALTAGANDFIAKPFDIDELMRLVSRYSNQQAA